MSEQPSTSRLSVALSAAFLVLSAAVFAAAYYLLGGPVLVAPLVEQVADLAGFAATQSPDSTPVQPVVERLSLPKGMPEEFALRLWQEQVESQAIIERLVNGEVRSLTIDRVVKSSGEAQLYSTVEFTDGVKSPGVIGLKRFGDAWYVAYASAESGGKVPLLPSTSLPDTQDIDVPLLNTIVSENLKSRSVVQEYVDGIVKRVDVEAVRRGPKTVTLDLEMNESHGNGYAKLVAIQSESKGEPVWFLARFMKTQDERQ